MVLAEPAIKFSVTMSTSVDKIIEFLVIEPLNLNLGLSMSFLSEVLFVKSIYICVLFFLLRNVPFEKIPSV